MGRRNEHIIRTPIWKELIFNAFCLCLALLSHNAIGEHGLLGALEADRFTRRIALFSMLMYGLAIVHAMMGFSSPRKIIVSSRGIMEKMPGKTISVGWDAILGVDKGSMGIIVKTAEGKITLGQGMFVADKALKVINSYSDKSSRTTGAVTGRANGSKRGFGKKT